MESELDVGGGERFRKISMKRSVSACNASRPSDENRCLFLFVLLSVRFAVGDGRTKSKFVAAVRRLAASLLPSVLKDRRVSWAISHELKLDIQQEDSQHWMFPVVIGRSFCNDGSVVTLLAVAKALERIRDTTILLIPGRLVESWT